MRESKLEHFQKKIRGRLKTWKEEEHRADRALEKATVNPILILGRNDHPNLIRKEFSN